MKRTFFINMLMVGCMGAAMGATYTNLTGSWCDEENNVIYNGNGYFAVESVSNTSIDITISLSSLESYVNSNDYKTGNYLLLWDDNAADYGLADNADTSVDNGSRTPFLSGYWNNAAWNANSSDTNYTISYEELSTYATNGSLTLNITNSSTKGEGVKVTAKDSSGNTATLYHATDLCAASNTITHGYYVNLNYVTAVTLNTASTLDTGSYVPPKDYSKPFVSERTDGTSVGRVSFLGDSITHGVNDQSYRWQLFKVLTDNGIENEIVGPRDGYYSTPEHTEDAGSSYGGVEFANVHLAQASGRTHNIISGSTSALGYSSGVNYGGHSTSSTAAKYNSNTWFCMMGTNDLLSDTPNSGPTNEQYATQMQKCFGGQVNYDSTSDKYNWTAGSDWGTMGKIISDVCGSGDTFYMLSITPWGNHSNHNRDMDHYAGAEFNRNLEAWTKAYAQSTGQNVVFVDLTRGMVDLSSDKRFMGHNHFFNSSSDRLHPNDQGSLIMAGNLAQAMGIGGRTAGLERMGTDGWQNATMPMVTSNSSTLFGENAFTMEDGYTVDVSAIFGDGATNGWMSADNALSIALGDGTNSGTLNLSEGYISWGDEVLFCRDNSSTGTDGSLRIAWHNGNETDNVLKGYYVWLGDMLIGQGLAATSGEGLNGILISATGASGSVNSLSWTNTAYAPTTQGKYSAQNAFLTTQAAATVNGFVENSTLPVMPETSRNNTSVTSGLSYTGINAQTLTSGGKLVTTAPTAPSSFVLSSTAGWIGMVDSANGKPTGDVNVQLTGEAKGTIFGSMNNAAAHKLVLEIENGATVTNGTYTYNNVVYGAAIAGSYGGGNAKSFNVYLNGGTVNGDIVGGSINGTGTVESVNIIINSGKVAANVIGGAKINGARVGEASIMVNGGHITGNIVAGGETGAVVGNAEVRITGGVIDGNITKGSAETASVTVEGNKAYIGGNITADKVTLKNVAESGYKDGFDRYAGTITAQDVTLDNVTSNLRLTLENTNALELSGESLTSIVMGHTAELNTLTLRENTSLSLWKSAAVTTATTEHETTLTVAHLTVETNATLNANLVFTKDSLLTLSGSLAMGSTVDITTGMTLTLNEHLLQVLYSGEGVDLFTGVDALRIDGVYVSAGSIVKADGLFNGLDTDYSYMLAYSQSGDVTLSTYSIPEPATATLSLLALAALAARRRRK